MEEEWILFLKKLTKNRAARSRRLKV